MANRNTATSPLSLSIGWADAPFTISCPLFQFKTFFRPSPSLSTVSDSPLPMSVCLNKAVLCCPFVFRMLSAGALVFTSSLARTAASAGLIDRRRREVVHCVRQSSPLATRGSDAHRTTHAHNALCSARSSQSVYLSHTLRAGHILRTAGQLHNSSVSPLDLHFAFCLSLVQCCTFTHIFEILLTKCLEYKPQQNSTSPSFWNIPLIKGKHSFWIKPHHLITGLHFWNTSVFTSQYPGYELYPHGNLT